MRLLLINEEPCVSYTTYSTLLDASKANVNTIAKALSATEDTTINYSELVSGKWINTTANGWVKKEDKYLSELTKPSGKTGKWIHKLKTLCEDFQKIKSENQIVPGLRRIIKHCTYTAGAEYLDDKLPLYMYPDVHILYTEIALRLRDYSKFVEDEMKNGHPHQGKTGISE